jgi:hypothetical protein
VTGNAQHAQKAIQIIDAWSAVFVEIVPADGSPGVQDSLEADWYAPIWVNAAEILRHYGGSGWTSANINRFGSRMANHFRQHANGWAGSGGCCPNQGISAAYARMAVGIYLDDQATYDSGLNHYRNTMLARSVAPSGELLEINRIAGGDCGHSAYNIEGGVQIAELAYHQGGADLYQLKLSGDTTPRLLSGIEWMARCITNGQNTTSEGFVHCSTQKPLGFEAAYNHYINRLSGYSLPNTSALLGQIRPLDQGTGKFVPWDTLTHAQLSAGSGGGTPTPTASPTATTQPSGTAQPTATATARPTATPTSGGATTWAANTFYSVGTNVTYSGVSYRCQQAHTSQAGWEPPNTPALWQRL